VLKLKYNIEFEYDELITSCFDCPICYDTLRCSADESIRIDFFKIPVGCKLIKMEDE